MKIDYEKELNPGQFEAVSQTEGASMVIAGAGSGKTRTLVYRVARLLESGIAPENILLLTFTRKASMEMLFRASALLDDRCSRVSGGTFHSVGNLLLRRYGSRIGIASNFTIMDMADSQDAIHLLKAEKGYTKKLKKFPRKSTLASILSLSLNKREPVEKILSKYHEQFLEFYEEIVELQDAYTEYKKTHNMLDYDDLLVYFKELLEDPEFRQQIEQQYQVVMVDEYQDTNLLQAEIVSLLGGGHNNVMAVGDPAQSIYSFRGANFGNIKQFEEYFPSMKVIKLEENYRSTQKILTACNAIMRPAKEKFSKNLFTQTKDTGELPVLVENETPVDEACFITDTIEELSMEPKVPLNQMAVLFRSSRNSYQLELELNKRGIPFVKHGGFKLVETAHVKDLLAHLRVIANPDDTVSWTRLLLLIEGMGPKTCEKVVRQLLSAENCFVFTKLKGFPKFQEPFRELEKLFSYIASPVRSPVKAMEKLLKYYSPIIKCKYDDYPRRQKDLEQFMTLARNYQSLEALLSDMALEPPNTAKNGTMMPSEKAMGEYLILSTVHSSKGLEWDTVFVMGLNENGFPSYYAMEKDEDLEEERRLFYVAATRAKERLYFTYFSSREDRYGNPYSIMPSPFLEPLKGKGLVKVIGDWF